MLKQLFSNNRIFAGLVCLLVFIAAGLVYLNHVKCQANRDVQRTQEQVKALQTRQIRPKPPPPGETHESGHWHGDEWHAGSHDAHAPATTPSTTSQPAGNGETDLSARMWTGAPLRGTLSPGTLSDAEFHARDAEIQRLSAERTALARRTDRRISQTSKLHDEVLLTLNPQRDAIRAEQDAVRANALLSGAEKERLLSALDKQYNELTAVKKARMDKARALNEEATRLSEEMKVLKEQIEVLRAQRRKTDG